MHGVTQGSMVLLDVFRELEGRSWTVNLARRWRQEAGVAAPDGDQVLLEPADGTSKCNLELPGSVPGGSPPTCSPQASLLPSDDPPPNLSLTLS